MTATERLYSLWLHARTEKEKAEFEGQLAAVCIAACRKAHLTPPFTYEDRVVHRVRAIQKKSRLKSPYTPSDIKRSQGTDPNPFWLGRFLLLPPWVKDWVKRELFREKTLEDGGRYIGRRCVLALIDEIRSYERRRRGAKTRVRKQIVDSEEVEWLRSGMRNVVADAGLLEKLSTRKDKDLLLRLMAAYPARLSNVSIAREWGVSEGAIRKRRKRIRRICLALAGGNYQLRTVLVTLGLEGGTKKRL